MFKKLNLSKSSPRKRASSESDLNGNLNSIEKTPSPRIVHQYHNKQKEEEDLEEPVPLIIEESFINPKKIKKIDFIKPEIKEKEAKFRIQKQIKKYLLFKRLRGKKKNF